MEKDVIKFIDKLYRDLYLSEEVLHHSTGDKTEKYKNIKEYLDMLKELHERASISKHRKEILKRMYHDKYVIKPEDIPESFYEHQRRIALERGFGHIDIADETKKEMQNQIINDQEKSLDIWLDYFLSDDAKVYPFWAKYWAFQGMLKLGTYNKEKGTFNKRTKDTTSIFADLNREALALSIDMMIKVLNKESIDDKELEIVVKGGSFQRIYTYILNKTLSNNDNIIKRNEGIWIKYNQGSDHMPLVNSLQGYNTGWCTAGEEMAKSQLAGGDFYVYYTLDDNGKYKVPRIAIRMSGYSIGEIRGVAKNQNLEPEMEEIVQEKIKDFPDKDEYIKKVNDMKRLTNVYNAFKKSQDLSKEDLRFIYQIDDKISGFGYQTDPRIQEIISTRDTKVDIAKMLNCDPSQIVVVEDDQKIYSSSNSNVLAVYGDCYYSKDCQFRGLNIHEAKYLPKYVFGDFTVLSDTLKNITLPKYVSGEVYLPRSRYMCNVIFPEVVGGDLNIDAARKIKNVTFPRVVGGGIDGCSIKSLNNVKMPELIKGDVTLNLLRTVKNVVFHNIEGYVSMISLVQAKDLIFNGSLGYEMVLPKLKSGSNVVLPKHVGDDLNLESLTNAKGIVFPKEVDGTLILRGLVSTDGLVLPDKVKYLSMILSDKIDTLRLPRIVKESVDLRNLEYCRNLILPEEVNEVYLWNLKKVDNIVLPKNIGKVITMPKLKEVPKLIFPKGGYDVKLDSLEIIDKLEFPEIAGNISLGNITGTKELVLPKRANEMSVDGKPFMRFNSMDFDDNINHR